MSKQILARFTCDRCCATVELVCDCSGNIKDYPPNWGWGWVGSQLENGLLCPACYGKFKDFMAMNQGQNEKEVPHG